MVPQGIRLTLFSWIGDAKAALRLTKQGFPGADIGSDHNLLMMTMKLKIKKVRRQPNCRIKYNLQQLKDTKCQEEFEVKIGGRFGALLEMEESNVQILHPNSLKL